MKVLKLHYVIKNELDEIIIKSGKDINIANLKEVLYFNSDKRKCISFVNKYRKNCEDIYVGMYDQLDDLAWICTLKKYQKDYSHYGVVKMGKFNEVTSYMLKHFGLKN